MITRKLVFLFALSCGGMVANLYYMQTLIPLIVADLHLNPQLSGLIVTLTQIGYGTGLLLIVPLSDIVESRKLIMASFGLVFLSLLGLLFAKSDFVFFSLCFVLGLTGIAAQLILPLVAHLTPVEQRGKVVGNVMSGLFLGIMLSRPIASGLAHWGGWKTVFICSAVLMIILGLLLYRYLPKRQPARGLSYFQLIASFPAIVKQYPILRRRAAYQAMIFGVFSLFWSSIATLLMGDFYHYSQDKIALFAFVGAMGACVAPFAGRFADKGWTKGATVVSILLAVLAFFIAKYDRGHSITALIIAALLLDVAAPCNVVLGQRAIYALAPEIRGRLNALYTSLFFVGGAMGSALSGYLYVQGGWSLVTTVGIIIASFAVVYAGADYFPAFVKKR
ncbi:MAG: ynfM 2 [Gammaproteobacteria bacterium]|nr:ynfM 2 [Gammaproteobacteria bacterium]